MSDHSQGAKKRSQEKKEMSIKKSSSSKLQGKKRAKINLVQNSSAVGEITCNKHRLSICHSSAAVYCYDCNTFNTSGKWDYYRCKDCKITFHSILCAKKSRITQIDCRSRPYQYHSDELANKPLPQWDNNDVLMWVYTNKMDQLALCVEQQKITGANLVEVEMIEQTLLKTVPHAYLEALLLVLENINKKSKDFQKNELKRMKSKRTCQSRYFSKTMIKDKHALTLYNFTENTFCCVCKGLLTGLQLQGYKCQECGASLHICCLILFKSRCEKTSKLGWEKNKSARTELVDYLRWFKRALSYLERNHTFFSYSSVRYATSHQYEKLKDIIKKSSTGEFFKTLKPTYVYAVLWAVIDMLLKNSDKIFSMSSFLKCKKLAKRNKNDELYREVRALPLVTVELLHIFDNHVKKMQALGVTAKTIYKIYSLCLMRPPEKDLRILKTVKEKNVDMFAKVMETLSRQFATQSEYLNYLPECESKEIVADSLLEGQTYFFQKLSRITILKMSRDATTGSFLVTVNKKNSNYMLVVMVHNRPVHAMIYYASRKYFIAKNIAFFSVVGLVEYFSSNSLVSSIPSVDVKLSCPIKNRSTGHRREASRSSLLASKRNFENMSTDLEQKIIETQKSMNAQENMVMCIKATLQMLKDFSTESKKKSNKSEEEMKEFQLTLDNVLATHLIAPAEAEKEACRLTLAYQELITEKNETLLQLKVLDNLLASINN